MGVADRINSALSNLRDRRRRSRRRLEEIFSRKAFTSVLVAGSMSKLVEKGVVPFLAPTRAVDLGVLFSWLCVFVAFLIASVHWEHLAAAAEKAADAAEEATDTDEER